MCEALIVDSVPSLNQLFFNMPRAVITPVRLFLACDASLGGVPSVRTAVGWCARHVLKGHDIFQRKADLVLWHGHVLLW